MKPLSAKTATLCLSLFTAVTAACDAQPDDDYQGEPLARIAGVVTSSLTTAPAAEAVLLWSNDIANPAPIPWTSVDVTGEFPASFTLNVYTPPPESLLLDWFGAPRFARGFVGAVEAGASLEDPGEILAHDPYHELIYLEADAPEGSDVATFLGVGPLTAGYHLLAVSYTLDDDLIESCVADLVSRGCPAQDARTSCEEPVQGLLEYQLASFDETVALRIAERTACTL